MQLQHTFKFHYDAALGGDPSGMLYFVNGTELTPARVANLPAGVQVNTTNTTTTTESYFSTGTGNYRIRMRWVFR